MQYGSADVCGEKLTAQAYRGPMAGDLPAAGEPQYLSGEKARMI